MTYSMNPRAWRPAVCDEEPKKKSEGKKDRQLFQGGTEFEPGHRQRVRLLLSGASRWTDAIYDRVACSFWIKVAGLWAEVAGEVKAWTQAPPSSGYTDPAVS